MLNAFVDFFYKDKKEICNIIEPCLGIKIFTYSLICIFTMSVMILCAIDLYYHIRSVYFFIYYLMVLVINIGLYSELIGTRLLLYDTKIVIVKKVIVRNMIMIDEIEGFQISFFMKRKNEYPENLKIICKDYEVNFNKGLCSNNDNKKIIEWFKTKNIQQK